MEHKVGLKFNKLTVLKIIHKDGEILWRCKCDCGNIKNIYGHSVFKGYTKSCGCLKIQSSIDRMTKKNPMWMKGIKEKSIATNKRLGTRPKIRGGNGQEMPLAQRTLLAALGGGWYAEHSVPTRLRSIDPSYPTCYKIDIANPKKKIAIEVDGRSHSLLIRKQQDKKKDAFLKSQGWLVWRFNNDYVMNYLKEILFYINQ